MGWKNFHSWSWGAVTLKTAWHGRESAGMHQQLKTTVKALMSEFLPFLSSFNISSNVIAYSCGVRSTWHALLPTKPNLSVWGFTMPKGFGIGHHIREIPGTSKSAPTFGHTVYSLAWTEYCHGDGGPFGRESTTWKLQQALILHGLQAQLVQS